MREEWHSSQIVTFFFILFWSNLAKSHQTVPKQLSPGSWSPLHQFSKWFVFYLFSNLVPRTSLSQKIGEEDRTKTALFSDKAVNDIRISIPKNHPLTTSHCCMNSVQFTDLHGTILKRLRQQDTISVINTSSGVPQGSVLGPILFC